MRSSTARAFAAGILATFAAGLLIYLALVQLSVTGDYSTPDLAGAGLNILVALTAALSGVWALRREHERVALLVGAMSFVSAVVVAPVAFGRLGNGAVPWAISAIVGAAALMAMDVVIERRDLARTLAERALRAARPSVLVTLSCMAVATLALVDLAIRSVLTLNLRWDGFYYHLPFAAIWGGLAVPYDMNDAIRPLFQGYPPLPEMIQGLLWRLSGSVNGANAVNFIAFAGFLGYAHKALQAPIWLVALISLSAPLVLIHTTVLYVDLIGNAFLAVGVSSCLYLYLHPENQPRSVVIFGLVGLAAAAWSKYLLVPVVGFMLIAFAATVLRSTAAARLNRRQASALLLVVAVLASAPYLKNLAVYGNPVWPYPVPIAGGLFPSVASTAYFDTQRPESLIDAPQAEVFVNSLFEINVPTSYPNRPRWIVDQGSTPSTVGFRMGGFWGIGVIVYLVLSFGLLIAFRRRAGVVACAAGVALLCLVAVLPGSNNLRYNMFIPLTWAATIGMLYPELRVRFPRAARGLCALVLALFGYVVSENLVHYRVERVDYRDAAVAWGAAAWWPKFVEGETYCVVDMSPIGIMMTGPTMHEFSIVDRTDVSLCPIGTIVVSSAGIQGPHRP